MKKKKKILGGREGEGVRKIFLKVNPKQGGT